MAKKRELSYQDSGDTVGKKLGIAAALASNEESKQMYDEMGSPLDTNLVNKKRFKAFEKPVNVMA